MMLFNNKLRADVHRSDDRTSYHIGNYRKMQLTLFQNTRFTRGKIPRTV